MLLQNNPIWMNKIQDQDLYFSIHTVLYACKMDQDSDAAQVAKVKQLCPKDKCDIHPKTDFDNIDCPGKICTPFFVMLLCLGIYEII